MTEPIAYSNLLVIGLTSWISYLGFKSARFQGKHIFWPQAILGGREFHRLITSGFLHADGRHLLFNMISLYFFGSPIELRFGVTPFLAIYFAAIIGGNLLSLLVHRNHNYRAYGASGGVCGILFAHIFLFPGGSVFMYFIPVGIPAWLYAIGFMIASFYGMKTQRDKVGHDAHMGGAIVGLFAAAALHPWIISSSPKLFAAISGGSILLFIYLLKNPLFLPLAHFAPFSLRSKRARVRDYKRPERELDAILEKISQHGVEVLNKDEHTLLHQTSNKYQRRAQSKKAESELII